MSERIIEFALRPSDNTRLANLCGVLDNNLGIVSTLLAVHIRRRGEVFTVSGRGNAPALARSALSDLYRRADSELEPALIRMAASAQGAPDPAQPQASAAGVTARTRNQNEYLCRLRDSDVTFGEGPAGTGKTLLAVASAVAFLQQRQVRRIVLARPAVEAGENLGFLPGDQFQKVHPYLRPLEDALREVCGAARFERMLERGEIELTPLAFMRGLTLKDCYAILDEAQNTTVPQMKMFLTRLGHGSRCAVTGDISQVDLPPGTICGLADILDRAAGVPGCAAVRFGPEDVARHPVVEGILRSYENKAPAPS